VLDGFRREFPDRYFMEGISEQAVIGMAAGLAMEGYTPFVNTIATFLTRRCYEQIAIDLCLHSVPVRLLGYGGGVVYAPLGPTHLAIEDIALLRALPNMTVVAPCDAEEVARVVNATRDWDRPVYIRLAQGGDEIVSDEAWGFELGRAILMREAHDVLFATTGVMTQRALAAAQRLAHDGVEAGVLHLHTVKPLDAEAVVENGRRARLVVTVEEHMRNGGLGSAVLEVLADALGSGMPAVVRLGVPDQFPEGYGTQDYLLAQLGLDPDGLAQVVRQRLGVAALR
jgi:transketolase